MTPRLWRHSLHKACWKMGGRAFVLLLLVHGAVVSVATSVKDGLQLVPDVTPGRCPEIRYRGSDTCPTVEHQCSSTSECQDHQSCCYDGCRFYCADLLPICPPFCPKPKFSTEQVCGSNGLTYRSHCLLEKAACDAGVPITKASDGPCHSERCEECGEQQQLQQQQQQQQQQEHSDARICGSDQVTYNSLCDMKRTACILGENITLVESGICPIALCGISCEVREGQVCGSDFKTYENNCHLAAASCEESRLRLLYSGPCRIELTTPPGVCPSPDLNLLDVKGAYCRDGCLSDSDCTEDEMCCPGSCGRQCVEPLYKSSRLEGCPFVCRLQLDPVCGSDGYTYPNECRLTSVHKCGANPVYTKHQGRCK